MLNDFWCGWADWWATVSPAFAFLLVLPFAVVAAAWLGEVARERNSRP